MHILVIGAGIVGASTAVELLRDGHDVTIVESGIPGGEQAASFGNGAWLSPASVVPMSMPGMWRKIAGYLVDPLGPLSIRWTALPGLAKWLVLFLIAGSTKNRVRRTAGALSALLADAPARHMKLASQAGEEDRIRSQGLLYAYTDRSAFQAEQLAWQLRKENGVKWIELEGESLRQAAPSLGARYKFGAFVEAGAHCSNPGAYVAALVHYAGRQGARLIKGRAVGFDLGPTGMRGVRLADGQTIQCDKAVICAGLASHALALAAGDSIPLIGERGYHVQITDPTVTIDAPIMPNDGKMGITPLENGLRASGQVELTHTGSPPNWKRADVLLDHLAKSFPDLRLDNASITRWMGDRPSTPDGLPVIGAASHASDILYAFGHGHIGLASGPITGAIVADLVAGRLTAIPMEPYAPNRF